MNISNTFEDLLKYIENLSLTPEEYNIIINMLENYDAKLFVKILEEIKNGNLLWTDFKQIFPVNQNLFEKSLQNQDEIYRQIMFIHQIDSDKKQLLTTFKNAYSVEKENAVLSMINQDNDDVMTNFYNTAILKKIVSDTNSDFIDSMLLSVHDYIVPVDYNLISLNQFDINFAIDNHITQETMKKIKSLAAFASNYYKE